jgi:hypothetical protein
MHVPNQEYSQQVEVVDIHRYIGDVPFCWAVDVGYKNGVYAFFFSNGGVDLGVMHATQPSLVDAVDVWEKVRVWFTQVAH